MVDLELIIFALSIGVALEVLARHWQRYRVAALIVIVAGSTVLAIAWRPRPDNILEHSLPQRGPREDFVSSNACRMCHPNQYASWHATYHRTMTQVASPETVLGPFDGVRLEAHGRTYDLARRGDEFWVTMPDPQWEADAQKAGLDLSLANPPMVERRVVMTTGSHHRQVCWVAPPDSPVGYPLRQLPWYYLVKEGRWVPRKDVFLRPPDRERGFPVWNYICIRCHSVGGNPNYDTATKTLRTEVADLGITCEACHGPGREHIAFYQDPTNRYRSHLQGGSDDAMVNPALASAEVSSQICGQCHSNFLTHLDDYLKHGERFRAGGALEASGRELRRFADGPADPSMDPRNIEATGLFWEDGTCRVGGNEYNAMIVSGCYLRGELSCISCHSMHQSDPNDQLAAGMDGNQACLQCHEGYADDLEQHTHHLPNSPGSLCYNCHMPFTSYAVFTAMRSHRIDSPSAEVSLRTGRPNACNLCHLDETLSWTAQHLTNWYSQPPLNSPTQADTTAASLEWLLRGDAAQRAVTAWNMGWDAAHEASGDAWPAPFLAFLLNDPYSVVRYLAYHALQNLPGFNDFKYDFVTASMDHEEATQQAIQVWGRYEGPRTADERNRILLHPDGSLKENEIHRRLKERDDKPISLPE